MPKNNTHSTWKARFKAQWTAEEWRLLLIDPYFVEAWNSEDSVKCGELAAAWLYGNCDTKADAKAIMQQQRNRNTNKTQR